MNAESDTLKIRGRGYLRWTSDVFQLTLTVKLRRRAFWRSKTRAENIPGLLSAYLSQHGLELEDQGITQRTLSPSEFDCVVRSNSYQLLRKVGHTLESGLALPPDVRVSAYLASASVIGSREERLKATKEAFFDAQEKALELAKILEKPLLDAVSITQVSAYDQRVYDVDFLSEPVKDAKEAICLEVTFRIGQNGSKAA